MTENPPTPVPEEDKQGQTKPATVSRRSMLIGSGVAAMLGAAAGGAGGFALGQDRGAKFGQASSDVMQLAYPYRGEHQVGIVTPQQQQMHTAAYDMSSTRREDLIALLTEWTLAAERMCGGDLVNGPKTYRDVPPDDTGETMDLGPAALTITFGFGATLFEDANGKDRFGIAKHMPAALKAGIPRMAAEKLDLSRGNGDLIVQACSEDPMVALHAIHNLTRIAFGRATLRWSQLGYGRTSSTSTGQKTPRNLFGFKDGTANVKAEEPKEVNSHVWIQPEDDKGSVFAGGTYLCIRKIKQMMEVWDELILSEQENIIGRDKQHGAPLSGGEEFTDPDFGKKNEKGDPVIDPAAHIARVHPKFNEGKRMLRRGYNYMEGNDTLGRLEGGLFFIAFVRDPATHFIPVLQKMRTDLLTEYLQHIASSLFIIPPGLKEGESFIGEKLFK